MNLDSTARNASSRDQTIRHRPYSEMRDDFEP